MSQGNLRFFFICFLNLGITDPEESKTFPNLTIEKFVISSLFLLLKSACKQISPNLFVAPIKFVGLTALSVEMKTNLETLFAKAIYDNKCPKDIIF